MVAHKSLKLKILVRILSLLPCFTILLSCFYFDSHAIDIESENFYLWTLTSDIDVRTVSGIQMTSGVGTKYELYKNGMAGPYDTNYDYFDGDFVSAWPVINSRGVDSDQYTYHKIGQPLGDTYYGVMFKGLNYNYDSITFSANGYLTFVYLAEYIGYDQQSNLAGEPQLTSPNTRIRARVNKFSAQCATTTFYYDDGTYYDVAPLITQEYTENNYTVQLKFTYVVPVKGGRHLTKISPRISSEVSPQIYWDTPYPRGVQVNDRLLCYFSSQNVTTGSGSSSGSWNFDYSYLDNILLQLESLNNSDNFDPEFNGHNSVYWNQQSAQNSWNILTRIIQLLDAINTTNTYLHSIDESLIAINHQLTTNSQISNDILSELQQIKLKLDNISIVVGGSPVPPSSTVVNHISQTINRIENNYTDEKDNINTLSGIFDGLDIPDLTGYTNPLSIWKRAWDGDLFNE